MTTRDAILDFCDNYLRIDEFKDFGPNGLQVEGRQEVKKIMTGVSPSVELFQKAAELGADMILLHHGEFWDDFPQVIRSVRKKRLKVLFEHDISLAAYHLPLDAHPEIGNNALLIKMAGLTPSQEPFGEYHGKTIGMIGESAEGISLSALVRRLEKGCETTARVLAHGPDTVRRVGFISGGGASGLVECPEKGIDTFVTGESKEFTHHYSKDAGINLIYLGHYASETVGIRALGELLAERFGVEAVFVGVECVI